MEARSNCKSLLPEEPELPYVVEHIWAWFQELNATRGGGFGPGPITWAEIDSWSRRTGIEPTPWEARMVRMLDREYLKVPAEEKPDGS